MGRYGSDLVVEFLRRAGIELVSLNPGASFRALHDSLDRPEAPETIVTLHEEIAVAIAHGYAKSAGKPMAVFLHDQVGLQHASMALFNAYIDAVPMLVIGGTGPRDTSRRRPWVDWIHSGHPDAAVIRDVVKWDDEPTTLAALGESLARGLRIATTPPMGPVYVGIDVLLQEADAAGIAPWPVAMATPPVTAARDVVEELASALVAAEHPVLLVDRGAPSLSVPFRAVVESLGATVVDLGGRTIATTHWADQTSSWEEQLAMADLVVAVELRDVAWGLTRVDISDRSTIALTRPGTRVVALGLSELRHRAYVTIEGLAPEVERITAEPTTFFKELSQAVTALVAAEASTLADLRMARRASLVAEHARRRTSDLEQAELAADHHEITPAHVARTLGDLLQERHVQIANGLLAGWPRRLWKLEDEASYLGRSGGEGLGYGLPASLGAALAQRADDILVVDLQSDGDLMYTPQALWTAAHHELPVLVVVHNNRSYGKDEMHQAEVARARGRKDYTKPPEGIRLERPDIDYAALASSQGVEGIGPITEPGELADALKRAIEIVRSGRPCLVDVISSQDLRMSGTHLRGDSSPPPTD